MGGRERLVSGRQGLRQVRWLSENLDAPPERWDAVAREALALLEEGGLTAARAAALFNIGSVLQRRGDQAEWAIDCLRLSRRLWTELGDVEGRLAAGENLAIALQDRHEGSARDTPERPAQDTREGPAQDTRERPTRDTHERPARDTRAGLIEARELIAEALEHHRRAGDRPLQAQSATNLAVVELRLGEPERAAELCREALPLRPIELDPVGWAFTAANLALALTRLDGDRRERLTDAVATYRLVLPLLESARADYCRTLLELATVVRAERDERALAGLVGAEPDLRILRLMEVNPQAFGLTDQVPELREVFRAPPSGEEAALLHEAVDAAEPALTTPDPVRRGTLARAAAQATDRLYGSSDRTARTLDRLRGLVDHRLAPEAALEIAQLRAAGYAERGRWPQARHAYEDCLAIQTWMLDRADGPGERLRLLATRPALARHAAYSLVRSGDARAAAGLLERTRMRGLGGPEPGGTDFPLAYVVSVPFGSAVLLVRGDRLDVYESEPTSAAFFAMFHHLPDPARGLLSAQHEGVAPTDAVRRIAGPLGQLLQPVVDALHRDGEDRLTIVPTGPATLFPWAAAEVTDPATGHKVPACDLLVLSQAPSGAAAALSRRRAVAAGPGPAVVLADPDRPDAAALPGTRAEAAEVEGSFGGRATVLLAGQATKEALLRELPGCRYAHLACHGYNDWTEFAAMRLLLTGGDVTLDDLRALPPLGARLVFLSACQTGQADLRGLSDDAIGLPFALLSAGAAAVVSTLWPVNDRVTALMAGRFYRELAEMRRRGEPEDVALALQRGQRWLRTGRGFSDPYFWAGFVVHGS